MNYYHLCRQHKGKVVTIYEKCGTMHCGRIIEVDERYVWLERVNTRPSGFAYGYGGYGYGPNPYWVPVALAAVGGFALGAAFFW